MKADGHRTTTESEWTTAFDRFWLAATPKWFEWMGWILVLAVLGFVAEEAGTVLLWLVYAVSYAAVVFYFQGFFYSVRFDGFPLIKSERSRRAISLLISIALTFLVFVFVTVIVGQLEGKL